MAKAAETARDDILRRRVTLRLFTYGLAAAGFAVVTATGHLAQPALPLVVAGLGLLFTVRVPRFPRTAFVAATVYDAFAAITLALVVGSWAVGGLAVIVAAATVTIGRPRVTAAPGLMVAALAAALLVMLEQGTVPVPGWLPSVEPPADFVMAAVAAVVVTTVGIDAIRRLTADHTDASREARDATARWWELVEASARAMVVERDGRVVHANPAASVILGRSADTLVGADLDAMLTADPDTVLEVVRSPVNLSGRPAVLTVITDRSDTRDEHRRLERLIEDKDRFLATVSHEVRTPLTAVVGLAGAIEEQWDSLPAEEKRELISLLVQQSQEMTMIVDDLTVAARSRGTIAVSQEVVSLASQVDQVVAGLDLGGKHLSTVDDAKAIADPNRTRQIVRNLVTNAVRYGGPTIRITFESDGEQVAMHVEDDGAPVPEPLRDAIFEPYRQAHDDPRAVPSSMGLGLAVSRQLGELMGGSLEYSRAGGWNRFSLRLPAVHG